MKWFSAKCFGNKSKLITNQILNKISNGSQLLAVFSLLWLITKGQDFCQSYQKNNYRLIVHSHDNKNVWLIIDKHFWLIRWMNGKFLWDRDDRQAGNSSAQFLDNGNSDQKGNYSISWLIYDKKVSKSMTYNKKFIFYRVFKI